MRIAIIGAGGQIGRTLLERLAADKTLRPVAVVRNELTASPLRLAGFEVRCGEIASASQNERLLGDCDVLVNCAAAAALWGGSRRQDRAIVDALLAPKHAPRVIHFSSVAVYGTCIDARYNTFDRPRPDHPYGKDKLNLERYLWRRAQGRRDRVVVLRMGHVYGAEQWVSRFVCDRAGAGFRLPFDGRGPSNAVHVANVASAVRTLIGDASATGTFNLVDAGQSSWREVFDWNTDAIGAASFAAHDEAVSDRMRAQFRKRVRSPALQIAREVGTWARGAPVSMVSASPALRDLLLSTLSTLRRPELDQRLIAAFAGDSVRRFREPPPIDAAHAWLLSDSAPGEALQYPAVRSHVDAELVRRWFNGYSSPDALAPADDEDRAESVALA